MKTVMLSIFVLLLPGCGEKGPASSNQGNSSGNPVTAPVDYLGAVNKAQKSANKAIDLAGLKQAIQLYHAQEDRYPANLQELVTAKYIPEIPPAPAGSRLSYDPATGEVRFLPAQ